MWSIKVLFLMNEADGCRGRLQGLINDQINGRLSHGWRAPLGFVSCRFWFLFLPAAEVPPPSPRLCQQSCRCGERSHLPLWVCVSVCVLCDASTGYCLGVGLWLAEHSLWHDSFFFFFFLNSRACLRVLFLLFLPGHVPIKPEIFECCAKTMLVFYACAATLSCNCWTTTAGRQFVKNLLKAASPSI